MNLKNKLFLSLLLTVAIFSGCQRDDICPASTQTTSLLIIRFYDADERNVEQTPTNLLIRAVGEDSIYTGNLINRDSIAIPLRTDADLTQYEFTFNFAEGDDIDPDSPVEQNNTDFITFTYAREQEYLNRACSYKINFSELNVELNSGEDDAWIQSYQIQRQDVLDETQAHLYLYF